VTARRDADRVELVDDEQRVTASSNTGKGRGGRIRQSEFVAQLCCRRGVGQPVGGEDEHWPVPVARERDDLAGHDALPGARRPGEDRASTIVEVAERGARLRAGQFVATDIKGTEAGEVRMGALTYAADGGCIVVELPGRDTVRREVCPHVAGGQLPVHRVVSELGEDGSHGGRLGTRGVGSQPVVDPVGELILADRTNLDVLKSGVDVRLERVAPGAAKPIEALANRLGGEEFRGELVPRLRRLGAFGKLAQLVGASCGDEKAALAAGEIGPPGLQDTFVGEGAHSPRPGGALAFRLVPFRRAAHGEPELGAGAVVSGNLDSYGLCPAVEQVDEREDRPPAFVAIAGLVRGATGEGHLTSHARVLLSEPRRHGTRSCLPCRRGR
jgi:hypothetical protein